MKTYINHNGKYLASINYDGELLLYYSDHKKEAIGFKSYGIAYKCLVWINQINPGYIKHCIFE